MSRDCTPPLAMRDSASPEVSEVEGGLYSTPPQETPAMGRGTIERAPTAVPGKVEPGDKLKKGVRSQARNRRERRDESVFGGFASQGAAGSGSGLPARGDCQAARSLQSYDQALLEAAARDGKCGS